MLGQSIRNQNILLSGHLQCLQGMIPVEKPSAEGTSRLNSKRQHDDSREEVEPRAKKENNNCNAAIEQCITDGRVAAIYREAVLD